MEFHTLIDWTSPLLFEGMLGGIFFIFIQIVVSLMIVTAIVGFFG